MTRPDAPTRRFATPSPPPVPARSRAALGGKPLDRSRFPPRARKLVALLDRCDAGRLAVTFPDGQQALFGSGELAAEIALRSWAPIDAAFDAGEPGFAQSFVGGEWQSSDPATVLRFVLRHRARIEPVVDGSALSRLFRRWLPSLLPRRRSRGGRRPALPAIGSRYELGSEFFSIWLDPSMTYSAALFDADALPHVASPSGSRASVPAAVPALQQAQLAKHRRILDQLRVTSGARLLEIGCGWGAFTEVAARAGHRVTGLTGSPAQLAYARARMTRQAETQDLMLGDYRDPRERYDGVVSIETLETVAERDWPAYFETIARCLKHGARACLQTVTVAEPHVARHRRGSTFVQQVVLPGLTLPSTAAFERAAEAAGLRIVERLRFGPSYARTLASWRTTFDDRAASVRALGFDERFLRLWSWFLACGEAAFAEAELDVTQFTLIAT